MLEEERINVTRISPMLEGVWISIGTLRFSCKLSKSGVLRLGVNQVANPRPEVEGVGAWAMQFGRIDARKTWRGRGLQLKHSQSQVPTRKQGRINDCARPRTSS